MLGTQHGKLIAQEIIAYVAMIAKVRNANS
jgi:hypothetical protein